MTCPGKRRGRHLAAGHAVHGVVDEEDGDVLAAIGRVQDLGRADRGQVAIALVGEHDLVRLRALQAGRHRRRAPMRGFDRIHVEVVVHQHRTADRRDHDRLLPQMPSSSIASAISRWMMPCVQPGQ